MKRFSTTFLIKEIKIKTTKNYYYTPIRMTKIKNINDTYWLHRCRATGILTFANGNVKL